MGVGARTSICGHSPPVYLLFCAIYWTKQPRVLRCLTLLLFPLLQLKLLPHVGDNEAILKTAVVKKSLKPEYNEIFTYQCDGMLLIDGVLVVQVWDWDILEADDFIGEAIIRLNTFQFHANPVHTAWYALGVQVGEGSPFNVQWNVFSLDSVKSLTHNIGS